MGERGAELFIPSSVGTIMNNMNAKNAIGGGNPVVVNQNLNFAVGVTDTVKAEVMNMMPLIRNTTMQAVADSRQRGGTFADSLSG